MIVCSGRNGDGSEDGAIGVICDGGAGTLSSGFMRNNWCGSTAERSGTKCNSPRTFGERRSVSERHQCYRDKQQKSAEARNSLESVAE